MTDDSSSTPDLLTELEGIEGLTQPAYIAHGSLVERGHRRRPGLVLVHRESERREHKILRRNAIGLRLSSGHPHQRPLTPFHFGTLFGSALESHARAHGARLPQATERGIARLQLAEQARAQHRVALPAI